MIFIFLFSMSLQAANQCFTYAISPGDGEGVVRYCDDGADQTLYLSGDLDTNRDWRSAQKAMAKMRVSRSGKFTVITRDSGGGDVEWHQKLMMAVEDHCLKSCRIQTEVHGACDSACNQLHVTCARGATTSIISGGHLCEHATTDDGECHMCDPNPPYECNICGPAESVDEYTSRCGRLLNGRPVDLDLDRKKMVVDYANWLASTGVFSTNKLSCYVPPWATRSSNLSRARF